MTLSHESPSTWGLAFHENAVFLLKTQNTDVKSKSKVKKVLCSTYLLSRHACVSIHLQSTFFYMKSRLFNIIRPAIVMTMVKHILEASKQSLLGLQT